MFFQKKDHRVDLIYYAFTGERKIKPIVKWWNEGYFTYTTWEQFLSCHNRLRNKLEYYLFKILYFLARFFWVIIDNDFF